MQNNTFLGQINSQNLIVLDEVSSTNDYLKAKLPKSTPLPEYTAIMARNQTAGRGQRDKVFFGNPGESLTFSFVLYPDELSIEQQFFLTIVVALGINDWLSQYSNHVYIKWPNDMILHDKKLVGVLIENSIRQKSIVHAVVGIGINVFQKQFPAEIANKATSMIQHINLSSSESLEEMCLAVIDKIRKRYQTLTDENSKKILLGAYNEKLFRKGIESLFDIDGQRTAGIITGVDETGKLQMNIDGKPHVFSLHEISMVF